MANPVGYSVLIVLILTLVSGASASGSCDVQPCEPNLENARPYSAMVRCMQGVEPYCTEEFWQENINKDFGAPLDATFMKTCANPLDDASDACNTKTIQTTTFDSTNTECRNVEDVWTCTRPYFDDIKTNCPARAFKKMVINSGNQAMVEGLDECVRKGYNVTVDYSSLYAVSGVSTSGSCDVGPCELNVLSGSKRPFSAMVRCFQGVEPYCPKDFWQKNINKDFGAPLDATFMKTCANPLDDASDACNTKTIQTTTFKATNTECRNVEDVWNCTRPYFDDVKTNCPARAFKKMAIESGDQAMVEKLDACVKKGYKVTVDYSSPDAVQQAVIEQLNLPRSVQKHNQKNNKQ